METEVKLDENDVSGTELSKLSEQCKFAVLKRWLSSRGAKVLGKHGQLIERLVVFSICSISVWLI